ncbi:MAG: hypothetical protein JSR55_06345 [Proteobacteria bacterium]|nr:hypothetical protein [Pseudomonadota bacterium]
MNEYRIDKCAKPLAQSKGGVEADRIFFRAFEWDEDFCHRHSRFHFKTEEV